jgi:hypothetical protein
MQNRLNLNKRKLNFFEQNPYVISALLKNEFEPVNEIVFSNELIVNEGDGAVIVMVVSPFCNHCSNAINFLIEYFHYFENSKIILRFSSDKEPSSVSFMVIQHLLLLLNNRGSEVVLEAIRKWYLIKNKNEKAFMKWNEEFQVENISEKEFVKETIFEVNNWIEKNNIIGTPVLIINNRILPPNINLFSVLYYLKYFKI